MAGNERFRKNQREFLTHQRFQDAVLGQPPNTVKRLLKRQTAETPEDAINRAQLLSWWPYVTNPIPRSDSALYWVWFVPENVI